MDERTLVIVKPDGVRRGLTGRILAQFEEVGLRLVRLELRSATPDLIQQHYPSDDGWLATVGGKTITDYERAGRQLEDDFGTADPVAIGRAIKHWLIDYLTEGSVVAMILAGNDAVTVVRKLCGHTIPVSADPASIRGRFSADSAAAANAEKRPVNNLVHASGTAAEATSEIALWFPEVI
jgi:nucleoside-diphosphate kinase